MKEESLELAKKRVIERISTMDAPLQDRVELMINLLHFLDEYEESIKILQEHRDRKKLILKIGDYDGNN